MCLCFRNVSYKQNIARFYLLAIQFFNLLTGKFDSFTFIVIPYFITTLCGAIFLWFLVHFFSFVLKVYSCPS